MRSEIAAGTACRAPNDTPTIAAISAKPSVAHLLDGGHELRGGQITDSRLAVTGSGEGHDRVPEAGVQVPAAVNDSRAVTAGEEQHGRAGSVDPGNLDLAQPGGHDLYPVHAHILPQHPGPLSNTA